MTANSTVEKVTFSINSQLKEKLKELKVEMHTSMSAIYNDALQDYIKKQELKKWELGVQSASKDKDYLDFCHNVSESEDELYDY